MSHVSAIALGPEDELALCRHAASGDASARQSLYQHHATAVMTLAARILCDRSSAEDVVQDTFMKAFDKLHAFNGSARFGTWLRRIAINECLQRLRSPWHTRATAFDESLAPPDALRSADPGGAADQIDVLRALATLDAMSRAVVWLHDVEGLTHAEIATLMDRTPSFSKSRLARAHRALRDALDPAPASVTASESPSCTHVLKTY